MNLSYHVSTILSDCLYCDVLILFPCCLQDKKKVEEELAKHKQAIVIMLEV